MSTATRPASDLFPSVPDLFREQPQATCSRCSHPYRGEQLKEQVSDAPKLMTCSGNRWQVSDHLSRGREARTVSVLLCECRKVEGGSHIKHRWGSSRVRRIRGFQL